MKDGSLDRLYVASPCSASWDDMPGDAQVRFCNQCQLNVYNVSAMTRNQAERLIIKTEGRLCVKLYRRHDGTIITHDCPNGLRAMKRRVSRAASAALSAILGLWANQTVVWADDGNKNCMHYTAKILRHQSNENIALIQGTVSDINQAVIADAKVTIISKETKRKYDAKTDAEGKYRVSSLQPGSYTIIIESPGFSSFKKENLQIKTGEALQFNVTLQVGSLGGAAFLPATPERGKGQKADFSQHV